MVQVYQGFQSSFIALIAEGNSITTYEKKSKIFCNRNFESKNDIFLEIMSGNLDFSKNFAHKLNKVNCLGRLNIVSTHFEIEFIANIIA